MNTLKPIMVFVSLLIFIICLILNSNMNKLKQRTDKLEKQMVEYNVRMKVLEAIIQCESGGRHIDGVLAKVGVDKGICQINTYWHGDRATAMGLDLDNIDDNVQYGLFLLQTEGTKPWRASKHCWQPVLKALEQKQVIAKYKDI